MTVTEAAGATGAADAAGAATESGPLLSIGAAAERAGVSQRALRYYQELGLVTPACTPGGLRRYSEENLARVARIRELQSLLGLNLDEIAVVLAREDRIGEIRQAYYDASTVDAERHDLLVESLRLQRELRAVVLSKRAAMDDFLADLDARIARIHALLEEEGA
ncbi:MAG TPA: MerR family transcriptional regulator [Acidimicrobiales bacterium]|nr:MerR family transcriptional regulator [Acidimicrobiales bacterium]